MEVNETFANDVDKTQIPPLNQKRILAFVNHFLISTCTFLNEFALGCETKFIELERKLQKTETALIILEAKLASIPTDNESTTATAQASTTTTSSVDTDAPVSVAESVPSPAEPEQSKGVRVCDDVRYKKFFKMVHVGVPAAAVKLKMSAEGLEPSLLDTPDLILPDGLCE